MTYRDDLEAAQARAAAAERRAAQLEKKVAELEQGEPEHAVPVPIPERFRLHEEPGGFAVSWRWFRAAQHLFLLFFVIVWDSFLVVWYANAIGTNTGWLTIVFPIAHVAVGVGLTYSVLTGILNATTISVRGDTLRVHHGPLPWRGNHEIERYEIQQLFVTEDATTDDGKTTYTYDLCVLYAGGRELKLVKKLETKRQARYLEHVFERELRIKDRPVPGEVAKEAVKP